MLKHLLVMLLILLSMIIVGCNNKEGETQVDLPVDMNKILPAKVEIDSYYLGGVAEYPIKIYNGNNVKSEFVAYVKVPDNISNGDWSKAPDNIIDWVELDNKIKINAKETKETIVKLEIPKGVDNIPDKWEFWVVVYDSNSKGIIRTEMASRWIVTMR